MYENAANRERRARAEQLGRRAGGTANAVALAWVLAQPFPTIAVIGPHSVEHLRSSLEALDVRLSAEEVRWLNLEGEAVVNANISHMDVHVIGVDFGTLSGRAVVVRTGDGAELGSAICDYPNAVIERVLPATGEPLPSSWALQDPDDYREVLRTAVPAAVRDAGVDPSTIAGIGIDFTASRPCRSRATVRRCASWRSSASARTRTRSCGSTTPPRRRPTGSPIWRRSGASPGWPRYGGRISSEWQFAKALQLLEEDQEIYAAMDRWIEGADWIVWQLCGEETRNVCTAGYKGIRQDDAYPSEEYLAALDERSPASSPTSSSIRSPARRARRRPDRARRPGGPGCRRASPSPSRTSTRT